MRTSVAGTPNKWVVFLLALAFAMLTFDLRYEHNHILRRHEIGWTPIIYSGLMLIVSLLCLQGWDRWGRKTLFWAFALGIVVGLVGYYQHNAGHLLSNIGVWLSVWTGAHPDPTQNPPIMSPLAFAGLGTLGLIACADRFQPDREDAASVSDSQAVTH